MAKVKLKLRISKKARYLLLSLTFGFLVGGIVLAIAGFNPFEAYFVLFSGVLGAPRFVANTVIIAAPLILTGLSLAFALRTGLFNIGAEGQYIIGSLVAVVFGVNLDLPPLLHVPVVVLMAMAGGALWGGLSGFLKAKYGVHEVISTIMLNWTAFYLSNLFVRNTALHRPASEASHYIRDSARIDILGVWKQTEEGLAWRATSPFWDDILRTEFNVGILFAVAAAIICWIILNRTTLGYELRAVGFNSEAARYAGIPVKRSLVTSMAIAGALAGLGGAIQVLGVSRAVSVLATMEGNGFDGISVGLIASSHPIGAIFSGLLFGALRYGSSKIQPALGVPKEIINIVMGTIVFLVSMPYLYELFGGRIRAAFTGRKRGKAALDAAGEGSASGEGSVSGEGSASGEGSTGERSGHSSGKGSASGEVVTSNSTSNSASSVKNAPEGGSAASKSGSGSIDPGKPNSTSKPSSSEVTDD